MAILVTGLLFVSANTVMAADGDAFYLFVTNGSKTVPVKISFAVGGCYLGGTGNGQNLNLAPGKADRIHVYRDQGSSCDGEFGYFTLTMTPTAGKGNGTGASAGTGGATCGL